MSPARGQQALWDQLTAIDFYNGVQYHRGYFTTGELLPDEGEGEGEGEEGTGSSGRRSQQTLQERFTAMDFYYGAKFNRAVIGVPFVPLAKAKPAVGIRAKQLLRKSIRGIKQRRFRPR